MLNMMCNGEPGECSNADVRNRHGSDLAANGENSMAFEKVLETFWSNHTATQITTIVSVTTGRPPEVTVAPNCVRGIRMLFWPSRTQSTHWMPTAAGR
jgi:hypothetical protein